MNFPSADYFNPLFLERRSQIVRTMRAGGYWRSIMDGDHRLDRVKTFLRLMAGEESSPPLKPFQAPRFLPAFPGINNEPLHDPKKYPWVKTLEDHFETIRTEAERLDVAADYMNYNADIQDRGLWQAHPFYYMGVQNPIAAAQCSGTLNLLGKLPTIAHSYPWSDVLFSAHGPGTHLIPHCSVDNLRLRIHMGISIPDGTSMRVGSETVTWEEGKVLLFEDSFEHEVWNSGQGRRVILIADCWHPDLTSVEIKALNAGFRKSEVRMLLYDLRLGGAEAYRDFLLQSFLHEDQFQDIKDFWS